MKKFYLVAALALAASATMSAKELTFFVKGEKVTPGASVTVNCLHITNDMGDDGKDYEMNPELFIMSDVAASDVVITATCTNGYDIQMCIGGLCQIGKSVTIGDIALEAGKQTDAEFHFMGYTTSADEEIPTVITEISAQYASDPSSTVKFTLTMEPTQAGIENVGIGEAEVVETRWYNLQGMHMQEQPEGIALKWERLSDGTVRTSRELNRR